MALLAEVIVVEAEAGRTEVATINCNRDTVTASSLPTALKLPLHTPALRSPAIPSRLSKLGTRNIASHTHHKADRTPRYLSRTITRIMPLRCTTNSRHMVVSPNINQLPSRPTARLIRVPRLNLALRSSNGARLLNHIRALEHTGVADEVGAAATTIDPGPRGS
jgi:hypothetical protein